jgi:hypothetical protein
LAIEAGPAQYTPAVDEVFLLIFRYSSVFVLRFPLSFPENNRPSLANSGESKYSAASIAQMYFGIKTTAYDLNQKMEITAGGVKIVGVITKQLQVGPQRNSQVVLLDLTQKPNGFVDKVVVKVYDPDFAYNEEDGRFDPRRNLEKATMFFSNEKAAYEAFARLLSEAERRHLLPCYGAFKFARKDLDQPCDVLLFGFSDGRMPNSKLLGRHKPQFLNDVTAFLKLIHSKAKVAHGDLAKASNYHITVKRDGIDFVILDWSHAVVESENKVEYGFLCQSDLYEANWLFGEGGLEEYEKERPAYFGIAVSGVGAA